MQKLLYQNYYRKTAGHPPPLSTAAMYFQTLENKWKIDIKDIFSYNVNCTRK
jgi:hypothetical protein